MEHISQLILKSRDDFSLRFDFNKSEIPVFEIEKFEI